MGPLTLADGTILHGLEAGNPKAARGTIVLVHGLGEHLGRYAWLTERLVRAGWYVAGFDQRGHGRSSGARGGIPRETALLGDLAAVLDDLPARGAPRPLIVLGHSMGGVVAARFAAEALAADAAAWSRPIDGLVLSSPALAADLSGWQRTLMALGRLAPDRAAGNGLEAAAISRDPDVVRAYRDDPLVHDRITPRLAAFILSAGEAVRARAAAWQLPTLLLWAGADRCVAPRGSAAFAAAAPPTVVRAKAYAGLCHEIFNEPEKLQVLDELLGWLDERWPRAAASGNPATPTHTS